MARSGFAMLPSLPKSKAMKVDPQM